MFILYSYIKSYEYNPWLLSLSAKFLLNDRNFTSNMIAYNPFEDSSSPPKYKYWHNLKLKNSFFIIVELKICKSRFIHVYLCGKQHKGMVGSKVCSQLSASS